MQRAMTNQNTKPMAGVQIKKIMPSLRSMARAATMEPAAKKGQRMSMRTPRATASCTWLTSLVMRVMSDGVPKRSSSA